MNFESINSSLTTGPHEVGLNPNVEIDQQVMELLRPIDGIKVRTSGNVVILSTTNPVLAIKDSDVDAFRDAYILAAGELKRKKRVAEDARKEMLRKISHALDLNVRDH
jgi:hypothetical protein